MMRIFRLLLLPFTFLFALIAWLRNRLYDKGFFSSVSFSIPVVSVGNLSVGGTGKTPHIEYLITLLHKQYKVATMSRGYKRRTKGFVLAGEHADALQIGDEPMQYKTKFPEIAVSVAEQRVIGIPELLTLRPETEIILLDDAFQHRSVRPGLNILITDFANPFFADHIIPYGSLREAKKGSKRADIIIVSKCPKALTEAQAAEIKDAMSVQERQSVFFTCMDYGAAYDLYDKGERSFSGRRVVLVSGIAKPAPLQDFVASTASELQLLRYPDHHYFNERDVREMQAATTSWNNDCVIVTTEKDAARLSTVPELREKIKVPILVLPICVQFLFDGAKTFDAMVKHYVQAAAAQMNELP